MSWKASSPAWRSPWLPLSDRGGMWRTILVSGPSACKHRRRGSSVAVLEHVGGRCPGHQSFDVLARSARGDAGLDEGDATPTGDDLGLQRSSLPGVTGPRKLIFISALEANTRRPSTKVTAAAPMAESAKAPRKPPCMIPAGLAKRSSALIRQMQRPGVALSRQVIPRVRSLFGGTCIREAMAVKSTRRPSRQAGTDG